MRTQPRKIWKLLLTLVSLILMFYGVYLITRGPELRTFEARVPVVSYETLTTNVVRQITRTQVMFSGRELLISTLGYRYIGPYWIDVGKTLKISWEADTLVNVYVLNDVDWRNRFGGVPTRWRASEVGMSGSIEFYVKYNEPIYIQVLCPTLCSAKLYRWEAKVEWVEYIPDVIVQTKTIYTEIIQVKTELQTSHIADGTVLAVGFGAIFVVGLILLLAPTVRVVGRVKGEGFERLPNYEEFIQDLKRLIDQKNLLKMSYDKGDIEADVFQKLDNELNEKISNTKSIIDRERSACENELKNLEYKLSDLRKRFEELRARRYLDMIGKEAFDNELQQIRNELENIKKRREYLKSVLEILKFEET